MRTTAQVWLNMFGEVQGTINCGFLVAGVEGSGDPRRKEEEMGEGRERKVLKSVAFVCKMI